MTITLFQGLMLTIMAVIVGVDFFLDASLFSVLLSLPH